MPSVLRPIAARAKEHLTSLWRSPEYRALQDVIDRVRRVPRYRHLEIEVDGWRLQAPDAASLLSSYREIVTHGIYRFPWSGSGAPRMLDLGANIGLAALDLKRRHPSARIVALEPDPKICSYLRRNLRDNGAADVEVREVAAWTEATTLRFWSEGADAGRVEAGSSPVDGPKPPSIDVEAIDVRDLFADGAYDFVKMDIEGAEAEVLPLCAPFLADTPFLFVEYHGRPGDSGHLRRTISLMDDLGYRVQIHPLFYAQRPFEERPRNYGFELQLNLFGVRDDVRAR